MNHLWDLLGLSHSRKVQRAIASVRDSVCGILRIRPGPKKDQTQLAIVGTAWCVVRNRYFVTAHHVFNGGKTRDPADQFVILRAPANGPTLDSVSVTGYALEDASLDLAIVQVDVPASTAINIPPLPVTLKPQRDGTAVLTCGCPAPQVTGANVTSQGDLVGVQTFLMTHANEGIVAAQYIERGSLRYELNVGWHHGESGGPIFTLDPVRAFAVMQDYRNIQTEHGIMAGPHRAFALGPIGDVLRKLGATVDFVPPHSQS